MMRLFRLYLVLEGIGLARLGVFEGHVALDSVPQVDLAIKRSIPALSPSSCWMFQQQPGQAYLTGSGDLKFTALPFG